MSQKRNNNALQKIFCMGILIAMSSALAPAYAEDADMAKAIDGLMVPDSPAFAVLGVSPQIITRPGSPRELAASLLQGLDANGHPQNGIAVDTSPYLLFWGDDLTLQKYRDIRGKERALSRIQLSLATAKGTGSEDKSMRLAMGLRTSLWDDGDPRLDQTLTACIDKAMQASLQAYPPTTALESDEVKQARALQMETFVEARAKVCRADSVKRNWNKSAMDIGAAPTWINKNSGSNKYNWGGIGAWTSISYGFDRFATLKDNSQVILHVRYRTDESIQDTTDNTLFVKQDSFSAGAKYRYGGPRQTLHFEGMYIQAKSTGQTRDESYRYLIGAELAVSDALWLNIEVGGSSGRNNGDDQKFITSQFKWALAEKKATK